MSKINHLLQEWPRGTVITSAYLKKKGVYKQLAAAYENSGWLQRIGKGAYKRKGDKLDWTGGLYALQELQNLPVRVGGKTAIELQGLNHYGKIGNNMVVLWKTPHVRLPSWFQKYDWDKDIKIRSMTLFSKDDLGTSTKELNQIPIALSTPERAILEYLYDVPGQEGFAEASYIMDGLATLRPTMLQALLEACKSIRVKRLFLYFADHYNHPWFNRLNLSAIELGKGKREIVKGGTLNKKYQIIVPGLSRETR